MKIALVGGSGFIGSATSRLLEVHDHDYTVIDIVKPNFHSKFKYCDVLNSDRVEECLQGFDIVYMFAAVSNAHDNRREPVFSIDTNIMGLTNVLNACVINKIERIVFCSSVWVYSTALDHDVDESTPLDINQSTHIYTSTKMSGEMLVRSYQSTYGLDYTIVRYGIAYGTGANMETALSTFVRRAKQNKTIKIFGDGEQARNFMHVTDHARANLYVLNDKCVNEVINFDGPAPVTLNDIVKFISEKHPDPITVIHEPPIDGDYRGKNVSREKASTLLDWRPTFEFQEGANLFYDKC
jgi:UDP-glucose 4-epimerase